MTDETTVAEDAEWLRNVGLERNALVRKVHAAAAGNFDRIAGRLVSLSERIAVLAEVVARLEGHAQSQVNNPNEPARQYLLGLVAELRASLTKEGSRNAK